MFCAVLLGSNGAVLRRVAQGVDRDKGLMSDNLSQYEKSPVITTPGFSVPMSRASCSG